MKITIKEAMKKINLIEQQINNLLLEEQLNSFVEYVSEEDKETSDYDFEFVSKEIESLQNDIFKLRKSINLANLTTLIGIDDLNISDGLIRVAQLNRNVDRFKELASYKQKQRLFSYGNDVIQYNERLYDVKIAQNLYLKMIEEIHTLQTAIDKANILTEIEI